MDTKPYRVDNVLGALLVSYSVKGIQPSGAPCGKYTRKKADDSRECRNEHDEAERVRKQSYRFASEVRRSDVHHGIERKTDTDPDQNTDNASEETDNDRF